MHAIAQIKQWGNSKALRLPTGLANLMHLNVGDDIELTQINEATLQLVVIPKKTQKQRLSLSERIQRTKIKQLQTIEDWDKLTPVGKEL